MALVLDETFDSSIPGGFATARSSGGTFTQTYNGGQKAVDLGQTASAYGLWDLTSVSLSASGEVEADIETISTVSGAHALGVWLLDGSSPAVSNGILGGYSNGSGVTYMNTWSGGTAWAGNTPAIITTTVKPFADMAQRHTINVRWDMGSPSTKASAELRINGVLVHALFMESLFLSLRPGVSTYGGVIRLHSIKAWDTPSGVLASLSNKGLGQLAIRKATSAMPPRPIAVGFTDGLGKADEKNTLLGSITGTVSKSGSPANVPLSRKVMLIDEARKSVVDETWSDAAGNYAFQRIPMNRQYVALALDYTQTFQAVAQAQIAPVRV